MKRLRFGAEVRGGVERWLGWGVVVALGLGWGERVRGAEDCVTTPALQRGAAVYAVGCAVCHGPAGRYDAGMAGVKALDPKPADFTDPLFNSREPSGDWFMVIKQGGGQMGFSPSMPSFAGAYTDEQIEEVVGYLKTLAGDHGYPSGDLNYFLPFRTKKAWPEDEVVFFNRYAARDGEDVVYNALEIEKRFLKRWQAELKLSHEFEGSDAAWDEFEVGAKYAFFDDVGKTTLLAGGMDVAIPLGGGDASVELIPFLAGAKGLGEWFSLQASAKTHLPVEDWGGGDVECAAVVHWLPSPWPRSLSPAVELTAKVPFDSADADAVQWTVLPQVTMGLNRRGHVRAAAGVELPLNERTYDFRFHFYLLWDFADGMFWEGWRRGVAGRGSSPSEYE